MNVNSLQVAYAERYVFSNQRKFRLAEEMIQAHLHPFHAMYGEWPFTIFLICILPPLLCYGFVRVEMMTVIAIRTASPRHEQSRPKLT